MFGSPYQPPVNNYHYHICGLYYTSLSVRQYLPQVELKAHATILSTSSKTILTQTFTNPSPTKAIREAKYSFPLYDGVSVVGFTCHVDCRTIVGEVKEKEKARNDFHAAVDRGETAGIFEQLATADVFSTTVGNIPPGARVVIKITYLGELKHDMEVDGIRFTIPNVIAPRYGSYPSNFNNPTQSTVGNGISITVDAEMTEGSFIQKILSPTHPISVSMGTTSIAPNSEPTMRKGSATLSLGRVQLDNDFVLQIVAKDTGVPKAILETHPTIPNQRALMATLVPKFALPPEKPEIVFICDRSGSMSGSNITLVRQALQVFLKSLPVGVMFNICSFGSEYSFLWPRSVAYSQATLEKAVRHVSTFEANYGGTEMLAPVMATIQQRYKDIPLEMMLLTDGGIWDQQTLFTYLNEQVSETKAPIRVYSLGVGTGASHSLIEGVAKAGNGFSQTVGEGEKMDSKVVRMLKGALSPHVNNYTLEVKYAADGTGDEDFEIIEKVADSLTVKLDLNEVENKAKPKKPISLFDTSVDLDAEEPPAYDETGESRYSHLPKVTVPHVIQAPQNIPTLFAFNRTTVYLLLGPDAPRQTPKSVVLRGSSIHGPLELEFPIQVLDTPDKTIHQLAVKKAMSELEQGRGWLAEARSESGQPIKELYESRFDSMVEREAVRLGVQFQVSGKWCSFVAIEKKEKVNYEKEKEKEKDKEWEFLEDEGTSATSPPSKGQSFGALTVPISETSLFAQTPTHDMMQVNTQRVIERGERLDTLSLQSDMTSRRVNTKSRSTGFGGIFTATKSKSTAVFGGLFGGNSSSATPPPPPPRAAQLASNNPNLGFPQSCPPPGGLFGQSQQQVLSRQQAPSASLQLNGSFSSVSSRFGSTAAPAAPSGLFGNASGSGFGATPAYGSKSCTPVFGAVPAAPSGLFGNARGSRFGATPAPGSKSCSPVFGAAPASASVPTPQTDDDTLALLIHLQTFEGYWEWKPELFRVLRVSEAGARDERVNGGYDESDWVTALVIAFFEERLEKLKGSWELMVDKARGWLAGRVGEEKVEEMVNKGRVLV